MSQQEISIEGLPLGRVIQETKVLQAFKGYIALIMLLLLSIALTFTTATTTATIAVLVTSQLEHRIQQSHRHGGGAAGSLDGVVDVVEQGDLLVGASPGTTTGACATYSTTCNSTASALLLTGRLGRRRRIHKAHSRSAAVTPAPGFGQLVQVVLHGFVASREGGLARAVRSVGCLLEAVQDVHQSGLVGLADFLLAADLQEGGPQTHRQLHPHRLTKAPPTTARVIDGS